jgi:hypothetical protein
VVTSLRFDTVPEPMITRIEAHWPDIGLEELVSAWQAWAPDALDELTVNLTLVSEPGAPVQLDTTRLTHDTGFAPTFDIAAAVADYVAWRAVSVYGVARHENRCITGSLNASTMPGTSASRQGRSSTRSSARGGTGNQSSAMWR